MDYKAEAKKLLVHYFGIMGGESVSHPDNIAETEEIIDCIDGMVDEKLNEMIDNNADLKEICHGCKTAIGCAQGWRCSKLNNYKHFKKA